MHFSILVTRARFQETHLVEKKNKKRQIQTEVFFFGKNTRFLYFIAFFKIFHCLKKFPILLLVPGCLDIHLLG